MGDDMSDTFLQDYDEFVHTLKTSCPKVFPDRVPPIGIGKGWWTIFKDLCDEIEVHLIERNIDDFRILQVKEKFGGLTVYTHNADYHIDGLIAMAMSWAARTCEICGDLGSLDTNSRWLKTLCEKHAKERQ